MLTTKISRELDINVPLVEIFKFPTLRALSNYVNNADKIWNTAKEHNLVLLKKVAPKAAHFFLIHDGSGEAKAYVEFCQYLDNGLNSWGIEMDKENSTYTPRNLTLDEIASQYIKKIQQVQPKGPYFIGGWSMGGTIAFEIARQLEQRTEEIQFLAIIDSDPPPTTPPDRGLANAATNFNLESELKWIQEYLPEINSPLNSHKITGLNYLWSVAADFLETNHFDRKFLENLIPDNMLRIIPNRDKISVKELIDYLNVIRTLTRARSLYVSTGKVNTPIYYFGATQSKEIKKKQWNNYCKKPMKIYKIKGDHFSIFKKPAVVEFAGIFNHVIKGVRNSST